jgi:hypothetical protein
MLVAKSHLGDITFKNHWDELSTEELHWYVDKAVPLLAKAFKEEESDFESKLAIDDEEAYDTLMYGLLTNCCVDRKKLFKLHGVHADLLLEKGVVSFFFELPVFHDELETILDEMKVGQFAFADMFFRHYKKTPEDSIINLFTASLDSPFDRLKVEALSKKKAKVPQQEKKLLIQRYDWYIRKLHKKFPFAFLGGGDGESSDWRESMLQMAKDGPFGDFYAIESDTRFVDYLAEMNRVKKLSKQKPDNDA